MEPIYYYLAFPAALLLALFFLWLLSRIVLWLEGPTKEEKRLERLEAKVNKALDDLSAGRISRAQYRAKKAEYLRRVGRAILERQ